MTIHEDNGATSVLKAMHEKNSGATIVLTDVFFMGILKMRFQKSEIPLPKLGENEHSNEKNIVLLRSRTSI